MHFQCWKAAQASQACRREAHLPEGFTPTIPINGPATHPQHSGPSVLIPALAPPGLPRFPQERAFSVPHLPVLCLGLWKSHPSSNKPHLLQEVPTGPCAAPCTFHTLSLVQPSASLLNAPTSRRQEGAQLLVVLWGLWRNSCTLPLTGLANGSRCPPPASYLHSFLDSLLFLLPADSSRTHPILSRFSRRLIGDK